jgi:hypothetical protein
MTASRFGYPFERRLKELSESKPAMPAATHALEVKGEKVELIKFRVPIELPKYRLANGRTASLQEEWLAANTDKAADFFESDPELDVVQEVQHGLLLSLVKEAELLTYFKETANKQIEPIILDEKGFVVNGNRRLSCWRDLYINHPAEYPHFAHIDVVMLPHCDDKEIDRIEATLQIKKDIKAKYSWEARAIMMRQKQKQHNFNDIDLADMYDMSEPDVRQARSMLEMADAYLKSRNMEHQWSEVSGAEEAFRQLHKAVKKASSTPETALLKNAAFALIDNPGATGGRLYGVIPKIQEHLPKVKEKLAAAFPVAQPQADPTTQALFGGGPAEESLDVSFALAAEIVKPENAAKVRELVVAVIETESELQRELKTAGYLLRLLSEANGRLQAAVSDGLRSDSTTTGALEQIESIETLLGKIRAWLSEQNA